MSFADWLRNIFRVPNNDDEIVEVLDKILRVSRRGALIGETSAELIRRLDEKLDVLRAKQENDSEISSCDVSITEADLIELLDCANRAREGVAPSSPFATAIEKIIQKLENAAGFTRVAAVGECYDALLTEVVGCAEARESDLALDCAEGTVLSVIQQGYRRADGSVARLAKVAVSSAVSTYSEEG